ncbi:hypothetical protein ZBT109_0234 [Zymobacter palmae]|uniref:Uncharacterized protein n=1 Tax=Zymobacter palmae TaxID=33074 RepID=A0A348HBN0_9GAMM|nr:hypothetical protein ZBT109_0234 [Zymobacter palmae]
MIAKGCLYGHIRQTAFILPASRHDYLIHRCLTVMIWLFL